MKLSILLWFQLLPKVLPFQQHEYSLIFERLEVVAHNPDYFKTVYTHNFKYNRTYSAVNITFDVLRDARYNDQFNMETQAYKLYSNEYRLFPMRFTFDYCASIAVNDFGLGKLLKCGNFTGCFVKKGTFTICNFFPDGQRCPPLVPAGSYSIDLKLFNGPIESAFLQGYGTIKYPSCKGCPFS